MLICPPDVITIGTVGYAMRQLHHLQRLGQRVQPGGDHHGHAVLGGDAPRRARPGGPGYASSPGCRNSPAQPSSSRQRRASAMRLGAVERIDPSEAGDRQRRRASRVGEMVVRRTEVVVGRPARRRDQTLDTDRDRRRDQRRASSCPGRNRLATGDDEGVDDHVDTFSSRAALPPRTSASSSADKPA